MVSNVDKITTIGLCYYYNCYNIKYKLLNICFFIHDEFGESQFEVNRSPWLVLNLSFRIQSLCSFQRLSRFRQSQALHYPLF